MFYILNKIYHVLEHLYNEHKDPRMVGFPLLNSPVPVLAIIGLYLMFVLNWGPEFMRYRKPYDLKILMRVYNCFQVISNFSLFLMALPNSYFRKDFSWLCQPIDSTNRQQWMQNLILLTYGYYITKYVDLLDTVFFVLRKKRKQITFLHVYHHAGMVFAGYVYVKFYVGSHSTMLGLINTMVHTVMYGYYFITSIKPEIGQKLWWKKYITQIQLFQFGYLVFHYALVLLWNTCQHPLFVTLVGLTQNLFMLIMFFDFYLKSYVNKRKTLQKIK